MSVLGIVSLLGGGGAMYFLFCFASLEEGVVGSEDADGVIGLDRRVLLGK